MKPWLACAVLGMVCAAPAWAEVVINEVDTNPPGDDVRGTTEWVELYNSGPTDVDVSGWQIRSAATEKTLVLPADSVIEPGGFETYKHEPAWFANRGDSVELLNAAGNMLDATPNLVDVANDPKTWQRVGDGIDTDSADDWTAGEPTWGVSNGWPVPVLPRDPITISLDAGGPYELGQPVMITGSVSEMVLSGPRLPAQPVTLEISGRNSFETVRYPRADLSFSLQLPTGGALGLTPGQYEVTARYAETSTTAEFSLAPKPLPARESTEQSVSISTDRRSYVPGQDVSVSASAANLAPFEGLKMSVRAPDGQYVVEGTLFPDRDGKFSTSYMVNPISAQYGIYTISASYDGADALVKYEVRRQGIGEGLSVRASSPAYEPGQTVSLSGSSRIWTPTLDISVRGLGTGASPLNTSESVRLDGDGAFSFEIEIPEWFESFGTYRATVSSGLGQASAEFGIVPDSESYAPPSEVFTLSAGSAYAQNQSVAFSGNVGLLETRDDSDGMVAIAFFGESGPVLSHAETRQKGLQVNVANHLLLQPDPSGAFSGSYKLTALLFPPGQYTARAQYAGGTAATSFTVEATEARAPLSASLDKESYGLGETVLLSGASNLPDTAVTITISKPDGSTEEHGALVDSGIFEWQWQTPLSEITRESARAGSASNLGLHRIQVSAGGNHANLQFSVSEGEPGPARIALGVSVGSNLYLAGDKLAVTGTAPPGGVSPVLIDVLASGSPTPLQSARAYPGPGGDYSATFPLLRAMFTDGVYKVRAMYDGERVTDSFEVGQTRLISVDTARDAYAPGDLAVISASVPREERLYSVSVISESSSEQACGVSVCGEYAAPVRALSRDGPFAYTYRVPAGAAGLHEVTLLSAPYEAHASFNVQTTERELDERSRISDSSAPVEVRAGASVMSGSLLTRASDSDSVRLRLDAPGGACIIGPDPGCAQSGATGSDSEVSVFELRGVRYWLSYTGPDERAERFELGAFPSLPAGQYELSAIKGDEPSRLYYSVAYG